MTQMSQNNDCVYSDQYLTTLLKKAEIVVSRFKFKKNKKYDGKKQENQK